MREGWGHLVGNQEDEAGGWREEMEGIVQEHFGMAREEIEERCERMLTH